MGTVLRKVGNVTTKALTNAIDVKQTRALNKARTKESQASENYYKQVQKTERAIAKDAKTTEKLRKRESRVAKAEKLRSQVVGSLDTTGAKYNGYQI